MLASVFFFHRYLVTSLTLLLSRNVRKSLVLFTSTNHHYISVIIRKHILVINYRWRGKYF